MFAKTAKTAAEIKKGFLAEALVPGGPGQN